MEQLPRPWCEYYLKMMMDLQLSSTKLYCSFWQNISVIQVFFSRLNSLDEMDAMAKKEIEYQIHQSIRELRFQLTRGHHNLAAIKKKAYFRTITGTLLYEISVLLGVKLSGSSLTNVFIISPQHQLKVTYEFQLAWCSLLALLLNFIEQQ